MSGKREVTISHLGAQGDGVAETGDGPVYVPYALPGERWLLGDTNKDAERLSDSPVRAKPICVHFGQCGGCMAQHMPEETYAAWKHGMVVTAFRHRGIDAEVKPLQRVALQSRRRAFLGVERNGDDVVIGFREEGRHRLVDMKECPVLDAGIVASLDDLRAIARIAMPDRAGGRLLVMCTEGGLDVSFDNGIKPLAPGQRAELARLAAAARLARLTVSGDLVVERVRPTISIDNVPVDVASNVFLQAVPEAEGALIALVLAALPKRAKRVADLFCGLGTFAIPLARRVRVLAVDSDRRGIAALQSAVRHVQGLKPIEARVRDLYREPMSARELDGFDCVVFDPPRAGAEAQAERIAKSKVPIVVAVSCAPATLARDARVLIDGGYKMGPVTAIDQFVYTPHVEAVTVFRR